MAAKIFGVVMIVVGLLGFVPGAAPDGHLLGLFHINTAHNIVHLLTGAVALWVGFTGAHAAKTFFLVFGVIYGLVAILGFIAGDRPVLGFLANNIADAWLHVLIAAASIGLGLMPEERRIVRTAAH
jgi:hypothetical protein